MTCRGNAETPTSVRRREPDSPKSSLLFVAQTHMYEKKLRSADLANTFSLLPRYDTPKGKGGQRKVPVCNPFNDGLVHRLCAPTCSPDVFVNVKSPSECMTEFRWTIEDVSRINPAAIDSPLSVAEEAIDDETESQVQEAIDRYFLTSHNIMSPIEGPRPWVSFSSVSTPIELKSSEGRPAVSTPCAKHDRRCFRTSDASVQTVLSLPPVLPEEVLKVLEPYLNLKDESMTGDECNTSANTLRRKLFFQHEDEPISPVKSHNQSWKWHNLLKYILSRCNYLDVDNWKEKPSARHDWTPNSKCGADEEGEFPTTPDISPIKLGNESQLRIRLDFTKDMIVDSNSNENSRASYMSCSDSMPIVNETEEIFRTQEMPILDMLSHCPKGSLGLAQTAFVRGVNPIEESSIFTSTVLQTESIVQDTGYASEDFSCPKVSSSRQGKDGYSSTPTKQTS